ncbi:hypothetical protein TCSYLVIO_001092, partial [Trypanosoma cruzi]
LAIHHGRLDGQHFAARSGNKGSSKSHAMTWGLRRIYEFLDSRGIQATFAYVRSAQNPADGISRGRVFRIQDLAKGGTCEGERRGLVVGGPQSLPLRKKLYMFMYPIRIERSTCHVRGTNRMNKYKYMRSKQRGFGGPTASPFTHTSFPSYFIPLGYLRIRQAAQANNPVRFPLTLPPADGPTMTEEALAQQVMQEFMAMRHAGSSVELLCSVSSARLQQTIAERYPL